MAMNELSGFLGQFGGELLRAIMCVLGWRGSAEKWDSIVALFGVEQKTFCCGGSASRDKACPN